MKPILPNLPPTRTHHRHLLQDLIISTCSNPHWVKMAEHWFRARLQCGRLGSNPLSPYELCDPDLLICIKEITFIHPTGLLQELNEMRHVKSVSAHSFQVNVFPVVIIILGTRREEGERLLPRPWNAACPLFTDPPTLFNEPCWVWYYHPTKILHFPKLQTSMYYFQIPLYHFYLLNRFV